MYITVKLNYLVPLSFGVLRICIHCDWNWRRSNVKMAFKRSKETEWNQIKLNFHKYVQTKEGPIIGDDKHGDLFHKQMTLNYEIYYEHLIY